MFSLDGEQPNISPYKYDFCPPAVVARLMDADDTDIVTSLGFTSLLTSLDSCNFLELGN